MNSKNSGYMSDVDDLIASTPVNDILAAYDAPLAQKSSGEHRMPCVFSDDCNESSYGALTVNLTDSANLIHCHSCGVRGNLLTLLHGLEHRNPPAGGRLRGNEFKQAVALLRRINAQPESPNNVALPVPSTESEAPSRNIPLRMQEKTRKLVDLWKDLIVDPPEMPPEAAGYFRQRPWLTEDVCREWRMGYLPRSGRSLLRGLIVFAHRNEAGDIISYSGRDPRFEQKWNKWVRDGRPEASRPVKHRYVKGFHKGIELYGQHIDRLRNDVVRQSLRDIGLLVVEGQTDVIRLATLGATAVALTANKASREQLTKLCRFARTVADNRVVLMPDNDVEGETGFKDLLWQVVSIGTDVRLAWSRTSHAGQFDGRQPESVSDAEWCNTVRAALK